MRRALPPLGLLLAYGAAFGAAALGRGLVVYDDHPGQLYRLHHAIALGPAPWRLDPGWWAGYAELQYYPPGAAWLGALLHGISWGVLGAVTCYEILLWAAWLLPGLATYWLLARVLGSGWLALPGALVALTLSAGARSGVEEGLRWGLVAARLGWGALPLLGVSLLPWVRGSPRFPLAAPPLLAAVILLHPSHAPAALALLALGAWAGGGSRSGNWIRAACAAALGLGLAAVWLVPLGAHLRMALPLAWGEASLAALTMGLALRPLVLVLALASVAAWLGATRGSGSDPAARWLLAWPPAAAALVALDAWVAAPLGIRWLPGDRLVDGFLLALVIAASLAAPILPSRFPRLGHAGAAAVLVAVTALLSGGAPEPSLSLWPKWGQWPTYGELDRGVRLGALWQALREAPPGRVLFLRSAVSLQYRPEWWRPHSHVTALAPVLAGRDIVNGTFTHPAPVAGAFYTGSAVFRPVTTLVEQRDGVSLFGVAYAEMTSRAFSAWCRRLAISAVVTTDEDEGRLGFLDADSGFAGPRRVGPFLVYVSRTGRPLPAPAGFQRWTWPATGSGAWREVPMAFSPNLRARAGAAELPVGGDDAGLLVVGAPPAGGAVIELRHEPGAAEEIGLALSALSLATLGAAWVRRRGEGGPAQTSGS